ncbi:hypothetical protein B551_0224020 [Cupriavidus sp. HPC(L)]|nr:hypothetical protein B551_0224020 [Cupriavidus sp. HPC(L)]
MDQFRAASSELCDGLQKLMAQRLLFGLRPERVWYRHRKTKMDDRQAGERPRDAFFIHRVAR